MRNPYRKKKNGEDDAIIENLIKWSICILSDDEEVKSMNLKNDAEVLKEAIPMIVRNEKEDFVSAYFECVNFVEDLYAKHKSELNLPELDDNTLTSNAVKKFIMSIDNVIHLIDVEV